MNNNDMNLSELIKSTSYRKLQLTDLSLNFSKVLHQVLDYQLENIQIEEIENHQIANKKFYSKISLNELVKKQQAFRAVNLELSSKEIFKICRQLELITKGHVYCNFYYSSNTSPGLGPHKDLRDNLIIQVLGEKKWNLNDTNLENLKEEDCLFLPRGIKHEVETNNKSGHIVFAIMPLNIHNILLSSPEYTFNKDSLELPQLSENEINKHYQSYKEHTILKRSEVLIPDSKEKILGFNIEKVLWYETNEKGLIEIHHKKDNQIIKTTIPSEFKDLFNFIFENISFSKENLIEKFKNISTPSLFGFLKKLEQQELINL